MDLKDGKYTVERFAEENHLGRQSAINLLSKMKKEGFVTVSGGGKQKRIYTVRQIVKKPTNGFYNIVNKYSPEKLVPAFEHYVKGKYAVENAIIDGLRIGDARTLGATRHLFWHVKDWKKLFDLARKRGLKGELVKFYNEAREQVRCRRMPARYLK